MAQNTFALMTNLGRAKEAAAIANGTAVVITHIAIGDGATVPSGGEAALYHEVARKAISGHGTVVGASNVAYFDIFLEASEGPYTIREAGLIDQDGDLIAIARYDPPISKPIPSSGQTVEGTIRLEIAFSNIAAITIVVDPAFNVALQRISRLPWLPIISMTLAAPPPTPSVGDVYLIPSGASGPWTGQVGKIAEYTSAGWGIISPPDGHGISLPDGRVFEKIDGTYIEKVALDAQSGKWSYAVAGGSANALTATLVPAPSSLIAGLTARLLISSSNTDAMTLNVNGLGAKSVRGEDGATLPLNAVFPGQVAEFTFNGTNWILNGFASAMAPPRNIQSYGAAGSFTFVVPANVFWLLVEVVGAGGGGGGSSPRASAGGGGGGTAKKWIPVSPGQSIPVIVGAGGVGGNLGSQGGTGGTSSFGAFLSATGGGGGQAAAGSPAGGFPGGGSGGQINLFGGFGGDGDPTANSTFAGIGGSSSLGGGGRASANSNGYDGVAPGSGGGGVYGTVANNGGNGAAGQITIQW